MPAPTGSYSQWDFWLAGHAPLVPPVTPDAVDSNVWLLGAELFPSEGVTYEYVGTGAAGAGLLLDLQSLFTVYPGVTAGGVAGVEAHWVYVGSGGASAAGSAGLSVRWVVAGDGGAAASGEAGVLFVPGGGSQTFAWVGSGGASASGHAVSVFVPAAKPKPKPPEQPAGGWWPRRLPEPFLFPAERAETEADLALPPPPVGDLALEGVDPSQSSEDRWLDDEEPTRPPGYRPRRVVVGEHVGSGGASARGSAVALAASPTARAYVGSGGAAARGSSYNAVKRR